MKKHTLVFISCLISSLLLPASQLSGGQAASQYPIADRVADKVIQKYQTSSCQQLQQEKQQPPSAQKEATEQKVIELLHADAQLREHFLNKIAPPVVNKMFECGFIP